MSKKLVNPLEKYRSRPYINRNLPKKYYEELKNISNLDETEKQFIEDYEKGRYND